MKEKKRKTYIRTPVHVNTQKSFDSRVLGPCDAYFRLIRKPNDYAFKSISLEQAIPKKKIINIKALPSEYLESQMEFIKVLETSEEGRQYNIGIRINRFNKPIIPRRLPARLPTGSVIMWHKADISGPYIKIEGLEGKKKKFSNEKLNHHDGFCHTFIFPGKYRYHNGKDGDRRNYGEVMVKSNKGLNTLTKENIPDPVLVRCTPEGFDPPEVSIVLGQTVGWLIYDIGVSIIHE